MIGRKKELALITQGILPSGKLRCALINGVHGIGKSTLLEEVTSSLFATGSFLFIPANGSECSSPQDLLSQFTRNIFFSQSIEGTELLKNFARNINGKLPLGGNGTDQESAEVFVEELNSCFSQCAESNELPTPVLIIEDLDQLNKESRNWLSQEFNHALRKVPEFRSCRFIFTSRYDIEKFSDFWARFGIDNPVSVKLEKFNLNEVKEFAEFHNFNEIDITELNKVSEGIPSSVLKYLQNGFIVNNKEEEMVNDPEQIGVDLSKFSEKELEYLVYASYPSKINRYILEHFCSPKLSAFTYNWLKRQQGICDILPCGDLVLNETYREYFRSAHIESDPTEAERLTTLASVVDAFYELFPNTDLHWIPINLQILNFFTKNLCRKIFDEFEYEDVCNFLDTRDDVFKSNGKSFSIPDDTLLLIRRYMELNDIQIREGLVDRIREVWDNDQISRQKRKTTIETEKTNLENEIEDIQAQVSHFKQLKQGIEDGFKKPASNKPQRVVTFNISVVLIFVGLAVTGGSLLSDNLGSYHAACGLVVTIFGFFWPNVETRNAVRSGAAGSSTNLAIETQRRSLDHRINGLLNRANSVAVNLENLSTESKDLDDSSVEPYLADN